MRLPTGIPLIVRNVKIVGPRGLVSVDMIFDTGAAFTALSWSVLKLIGYDPSVKERDGEVNKQDLIPPTRACKDDIGPENAYLWDIKAE